VNRLVIPFSGQQDSLRLALHCHELDPSAEQLLLFAENVGIRASFTPPIMAAQRLADRLQSVSTLLVVDARPLQVELLRDLPQALSKELGLRTICMACQFSLLLISVDVAREHDATLVFGPREALGAELDVSLRRALDASRIRHSDVTPSHARHLDIVVERGQRCALADHHGSGPLGAGMGEALAQWMVRRVATTEPKRVRYTHCYALRES
jgi:hypothetical protein